MRASRTNDRATTPTGRGSHRYLLTKRTWGVLTAAALAIGRAAPVRKLALVLAGAAVAAGAFLLALVPVTAAQAAGPEQFKVTVPISFTDTTTCGFPIAVNVQDSAVGRMFFDAQGNLQSINLEQNIVGTESANGITLPESDHFVEFLSTGGAKEVGLSTKIQGGAVVIRDAGYVLFNPDGSVAVIHGPHPFLEGDTAALCAALS
jgi:hypothetical protein